VTLVSDADMVHADPEAVRFAGRSYLDGRAICRTGGAFHPKLIVTLSEDRAAVLVGSGNASPGGWIDNAELWTLLRADVEGGGPATLGRIADFLDALPAHVRFTPGVTEVLGEVGAGLRSFPVAEDGPQLVSSVWGPIIDQLPTPTSTTRMIVATPFHDRDAQATRRLHDRLHPASLEILVQPATVFDGKRLAATLEELDGTVATIADGRYHHGKLVEWHSDRSPMALTGSPNASRAALLLGLATHGNCELGLVALTRSLRPDTGEIQAPAVVADRPWDEPPERAGQAPTALLAVVLEAKGMRVVLRCAQGAPKRLEHLAEGRWELLDTLPAGEDEHFVTFRLPGGSALRLVDDEGTPSNVIWVTDLNRTGFRSVSAKRSLSSDPVQMAFDPHLVTMVEQALATVRAWSAESSGPGTVPARVHATETADRQSWRDYIDGFRTEVGDDFSFFVLPHLMRAAGAEPPRPTPGDGVGEEPEGVDELGDDGLLSEMITVRLEALRRSEQMASRLATYRRMCERLTEDAYSRPAPVLIAATVLTVAGAALGCWQDKPALANQLRRSIRQLTRLAGDPHLNVDAASIAAVALALLRSLVRAMTISEELTTTYRLAAREVRPLLVHATAGGVAERTAGLVTAVFGPAVTTARVMDIVESVTSPDHVATAAELLREEHGMGCEVDDTCIRITDEVSGDPGTAVLRAIGLAQDAPAVGATAAGPKGSAAAAWRAPFIASTNSSVATSSNRASARVKTRSTFCAP
jgi:hypothetical protein